MCGQIAYDWNTMPNRGDWACTKMPFDDEYTIAFLDRDLAQAAASRAPAIERSVVVLPQPLGAEQREKLSLGNGEGDVLRRLHDLALLVRDTR
jgi:hypothetical protein